MVAPEQMAIGEAKADCRACVAQRAEVRASMCQDSPPFTFDQDSTRPEFIATSKRGLAFSTGGRNPQDKRET